MCHPHFPYAYFGVYRGIPHFWGKRQTSTQTLQVNISSSRFKHLASSGVSPARHRSGGLLSRVCKTCGLRLHKMLCQLARYHCHCQREVLKLCWMACNSKRTDFLIRARSYCASGTKSSVTTMQVVLQSVLLLQLEEAGPTLYWNVWKNTSMGKDDCLADTLDLRQTLQNQAEAASALSLKEAAGWR